VCEAGAAKHLNLMDGCPARCDVAAFFFGYFECMIFDRILLMVVVVAMCR